MEITRRSEACERDGKHEHVFTNPHGFVFRIACFEHAHGAIASGTPSDEWSWFAGMTWRMALCGECGGHLGWLFDGGGDRFFGLITARIDS